MGIFRFDRETGMTAINIEAASFDVLGWITIEVSFLPLNLCAPLVPLW